MKKAQKQGLAVAGGIAALAAAATGVYFMTGKHAKNRKKAAKWVSDMQMDVVKELSKAGKASQATYNKAIDVVAKNYQGLKKVSATDLALAAAELKSSWDIIKSQMDGAVTTVRKVTPRAVKSVARKVGVNTSSRKSTAKKSAPKKAAKKTAKKR
jgi:type IV secretory pathway ATPase VirB11/archaellum biosynthesis ATPase